MAARSATIGDALVTWLNDTTNRNWPLTGWTAARNYTPRKANEDLDNSLLVELVLSAIGPNEFSAPGTRGTKTTVYEYEIIVRHRYDTVGPVTTTWYDARQELVEEMVNQLMAYVLTGQSSGTTVWVQSVELDVNDYEHAQENGVFLALITLNMRETRTR